MNIIFTRLLTCVKASLLMLGLCLMANCHQPPRQLGNDGAQSAKLNLGNSSATPNASVGASAPADVPEPQTVSSLPRAKRPRSKPQQSSAKRAEPAAQEESARQEIVAAFSINSQSYALAAAVPPRDPESLIAQASQLLREARWQPATDQTRNTSEPRAVYCRMAAETAEEAIKLLKADPAPTETAAKEKYTSTLLAGLSIRAEALSLVAVYLDRTQAGAAETAYREYLAIESDSAKKMSAEHKLATMFHQLKELEKAKSVYENLLARNPNDTRALAAMVSIYRDIAAAQNMAGQNAEAETSNKLAKSYSDRLSDLNSPAKADAPVETWDTEKPRNVDRRIETKTDTSRPKVEPAGEKKGPIIRRP